MKILLSVTFVGAVIAGLACSSAKPSASTTRDRSEAAIRQALTDWVDATNRGDDSAANRIWASDVQGWFPQAPLFRDSVAFRLARVPYRRGIARSRYTLRIEEILVGDTFAVVRDIWREQVHFASSPTRVERTIRGAEIWRLQADHQWRIASWVSAPEPWELIRQ